MRSGIDKCCQVNIEYSYVNHDWNHEKGERTSKAMEEHLTFG